MKFEPGNNKQMLKSKNRYIGRKIRIFRKNRIFDFLLNQLFFFDKWVKILKSTKNNIDFLSKAIFRKMYRKIKKVISKKYFGENFLFLEIT